MQIYIYEDCHSPNSKSHKHDQLLEAIPPLPPPATIKGHCGRREDLQVLLGLSAQIQSSGSLHSLGKALQFSHLRKDREIQEVMTTEAGPEGDKRERHQICT